MKRISEAKKASILLGPSRQCRCKRCGGDKAASTPYSRATASGIKPHPIKEANVRAIRGKFAAEATASSVAARIAIAIRYVSSDLSPSLELGIRIIDFDRTSGMCGDEGSETGLFRNRDFQE